MLLQTREAFRLQNTHIGSCGLWFATDTALGDADLLAIAEAVHDAFDDAAFLSCFADDIEFLRGSAQMYEFLAPDKVEATTVDFRSTSGGHSGTVTPGKSLMADASCVVSLRSAEPGPRGRGRAYFPPFDTGALNNDGSFSSGYTAEADDCVSRWVANVQALDSGSDLVVVSRKHQAAYPVVSHFGGTEPDQQRRRGLRTS